MNEEEIVKYVVVTNDSVIIDRNFYNNVLLPCMDKGVEFKNILTEFEKWLEEEMKRKNSRWEQFRNQINTQELVLERLNAQIVFIDCCLKRIQELKEV